MAELSSLTLRVTGLGHTLTLEIAPSATVADLKQQIEAQSSLPASYVLLIARGKKLNRDEATLAEVGLEDRTRLMMLHNEFYATDREGVTAISALLQAVDELQARANSTPPNVVQELVTQICCELDGVDTHGSSNLRTMRKQAIDKAEAVARSRYEHEEHK
jgi:hypothetical protein